MGNSIACSDGRSSKITTANFVSRSRIVHGNNYDYSKSVYTLSDVKLIIVCNSCGGEFLQSPHSHWLGHGCSKCASKNAKKKNRHTALSFAQKAMVKHGNTYDYSKVAYVSLDKKVIIVCRNCGHEFYKSPKDHLKGSGCPLCTKNRVASSSRIGFDEFVRRSVEKHGSQYDYSCVVYIRSDKKVTIKCNHCEHIFLQSPHAHLRTSGCPRCANANTALKNRLTNDEFITRAILRHGDKYDYSSANYISYVEKVQILCKVCGHTFWQTPKGHLKGRGCAKCAHVGSLDTGDFVKYAIQYHGYAYDYSKVVYLGSKQKVCIICKICKNDFWQTPNNHLSGSGCPRCKRKIISESLGAKKIRETLMSLRIDFLQEYSFKKCKRKGKPLPFDFYLPDFNVCIEFQGEQHFKPVSIFGGQKGYDEQRSRDDFKREWCKSNRIDLVEIKFDVDVRVELCKKLGVSPEM